MFRHFLCRQHVSIMCDYLSFGLLRKHTHQKVCEFLSCQRIQRPCLEALQDHLCRRIFRPRLYQQLRHVMSDLVGWAGYKNMLRYVPKTKFSQQFCQFSQSLMFGRLSRRVFCWDSHLHMHLSLPNKFLRPFAYQKLCLDMPGGTLWRFLLTTNLCGSLSDKLLRQFKHEAMWPRDQGMLSQLPDKLLQNNSITNLFPDMSWKLL